MAKPKTITARATVNLDGLRAGDTAQVDPRDRRVAGLLRTGLLVDEDAPYEEPETVADTPPSREAGRGAVKPQESDEAPGDTQQGRSHRRPRAASTASEAGTD